MSRRILGRLDEARRVLPLLAAVLLPMTAIGQDGAKNGKFEDEESSRSRDVVNGEMREELRQFNSTTLTVESGKFGATQRLATCVGKTVF